jgi:magnesium chelatase family protein
VALVGLEGRIVEVEADIGASLSRTGLVGIFQTRPVYRARDRCKAAVSNMTINLGPAAVPEA